MQVYIPFSLDEVHVEELEDLLDPEISIVVGEERPDSPEYDILVTGVPDREDLEASDSIQRLIIPYAGVPTRTRKMMQEFPEIQVHNLHYNNVPTAEMALALFLSAAKFVVPVDREMRKHRWFAIEEIGQPVLVDGTTALILGYGEIGRNVGRMVSAFNMDVMAVKKHPDRGLEPDDPAEVYSMEEWKQLLPETDVLFVCLPLTPETKGLIGKGELDMLPENAVLVNVARGDIVDEEALYKSLRDEEIRAAGIDVWYRYPRRKGGEEADPTPPSNYPFHALDNVVMSPHRAGWSDETESLRVQYLAELLNDLLRGETGKNKVDLEAGY